MLPTRSILPCVKVPGNGQYISLQEGTFPVQLPAVQALGDFVQPRHPDYHHFPPCAHDDHHN